MKLDILRRCVFRPYRKGMGPTFALTTWATDGRDNRGCTTIAYRLVMSTDAGPVVLFEGADFHGSPMHGDDSDDNVASLMTFLTLRPGDTDAEYFENYTDAQRDFADAHAEALSLEVLNRFGER
jgi:hypothetical protein